MTWPLASGQLIGSAGVVLASSTGTTVTASATDHTKGAWVELVASTAHDADQVIVTLGPVSNTTSQNLACDIGIGAGGSEVVIASNLFARMRTNGVCHSYGLPIRIPAGTRLAARIQADNGSQTCDVSLQLLSTGVLGPLGLSVVDALGFVAASTIGTQVAPGATPHTFTAWEQLIASTARPYKGLFVAVTNDNTAHGDGSYVVEIGRGAAASEVTIIPGIRSATDSSTDMLLPQISGPYWVDIPAGTRLSVRAQESTGSAGNRQVRCVVYGIG